MTKIARDHLKEIFNPMAKDEVLPSDGLLKALAKASGKPVRDIENVYNDIYNEMHETEGDQFIPLGPIVG